MSTSRVAHDPSVADCRATSLRCAQGGTCLNATGARRRAPADCLLHELYFIEHFS